MIINLNGQPTVLQKNNASVSDLVKERNLAAEGTAVAVNGRLCKAADWDATTLREGDAVTIINAPFGG